MAGVEFINNVSEFSLTGQILPLAPNPSNCMPSMASLNGGSTGSIMASAGGYPIVCGGETANETVCDRYNWDTGLGEWEKVPALQLPTRMKEHRAVQMTENKFIITGIFLC